MADGCIAVIPAILFQNPLLVADTVALAVQLIFLGKTLIAGGNAIGFLLRLAVDIEFLDAGLKVLNLELKCKNDLSKKYTYYVKNDVPGQRTVKKFDLADCDYEVRRNAGQIVLATFPTDFSDMNMLSAEFILHGITFE